MHNFVEDCHIFNFSHIIEVSVYAFFYVSFLYLSLKLYSFHHMGFYYTFLISIIPRFFYLLPSVISGVFLFPIISFNQFRLVYRNVNVLVYLYFIWSLKLPLLILSFSKLLLSPSGSQTGNCAYLFILGPFPDCFLVSGLITFSDLQFGAGLCLQLITKFPASGGCYSARLMISCLHCFVFWNSQHCGALKCTIPSEQCHQGSSLVPSTFPFGGHTLAQCPLPFPILGHSLLVSWELLCPVGWRNWSGS